MNESEILHMCPKCGELIGGKRECLRCHYTNVIPTEYNVSIVEHMVFEQRPSTFAKFKQGLRERYTINSDVFDEQKYQELLDFEQKQKNEHKVMTDEDYDRIQEEHKQYEQASKSQNIPKCPTCGSTNIEKISTSKKLTGGLMFGLFSKDAKSTFKCKSCGYKW